MANKNLDLPPSADAGSHTPPGANETALARASRPQSIPASMTGARPVPSALQRLASRIAGVPSSNKFLP